MATYNYAPVIGIGGLLADRDLIFANPTWSVESKRSVGTTNPGNAVGATDRSFHLTATAEQAFDQVRLIMLSSEAANNVVGATAAIAPTANFNNINTPTGAWVTFTWAGAGSVTLPTGTAAQYAAVASDWMNVSSVPRNDNPEVNLPGFMLRTFYPQGPGTYTYTADASTAITYIGSPLLRGRVWTKLTQPGVNGVGTPSSFTATAPGNLFPACIIQFRSRGRVVTVQSSGDSITGGSTTLGGVMNYGYLTTLAESMPGYPVSFLGGGWASQTSTNYLANAKTLITQGQPQVATYQVYSPNDGVISAALSAAQIQRAADFVAFARANNCVPILVTATPLATDNAAATALKAEQTAIINSMADSGVLVADVFRVVTEPSLLSAAGGRSWKPGLSADGTHPNDAGAAVMSAVLAEQIKLALGSNA